MADDLVKLRINDEVCLGVGQCELLEPETFELDDDEGMAHVKGEGKLPRARAEAVADRCPSGAISIEN